MNAVEGPDHGIAVIGDLHRGLPNPAFHDAAEDRLPDIDSCESIHDLIRAYPELIAHQEMHRDRYWDMILDGRVGLRERTETRRLLDVPDRQIPGERRVDDARRSKNRRANKAARAARRAGRR